MLIIGLAKAKQKEKTAHYSGQSSTFTFMK
jgi:hypothetical protein